MPLRARQGGPAQSGDTATPNNDVISFPFVSVALGPHSSGLRAGASSRPTGRAGPGRAVALVYLPVAPVRVAAVTRHLRSSSKLVVVAPWSHRAGRSSSRLLREHGWAWMSGSELGTRGPHPVQGGPLLDTAPDLAVAAQCSAVQGLLGHGRRIGRVIRGGTAWRRIARHRPAPTGCANHIMGIQTIKLHTSDAMARCMCFALLFIILFIKFYFRTHNWCSRFEEKIKRSSCHFDVADLLWYGRAQHHPLSSSLFFSFTFNFSSPSVLFYYLRVVFGQVVQCMMRGGASRACRRGWSAAFCTIKCKRVRPPGRPLSGEGGREEDASRAAARRGPRAAWGRGCYFFLHAATRRGGSVRVSAASPDPGRGPAGPGL